MRLEPVTLDIPGRRGSGYRPAIRPSRPSEGGSSTGVVDVGRPIITSGTATLSNLTSTTQVEVSIWLPEPPLRLALLPFPRVAHAPPWGLPARRLSSTR